MIAPVIDPAGSGHPAGRAELAIGLVGYGKIARDQHVPAVAATPGMRIVAIADPAVTHPFWPSYADAATMLAAHPEINAVTLCQPPQARFAAGRAAIDRGCHIFLEKPPGGTVAEAEALAALAHAAGVSLFTAWHSREAAGVATARQWLTSRQIRTVRIDWKEDVRVWHPGQRWISCPGGFGVFDPGINALSILTDIIPDKVRVLSAELHQPADWRSPIAAHVAMETASGVPIAAEFDFRQTGPQSWDIRVDTGDGELLLSHGGDRLAIGGVAQSVGARGEYTALYHRFGQLVRDRATHVDLRPLQLVADCFLCAGTEPVDAFAY